MDLAGGMTNESTGHLLVHSSAGQLRDHGHPGAVKTEIASKSLENARPVSAGQPVELPRAGGSIGLELQEEFFYLRHELCGVSASSLQGEGDQVVIEVHVGNRQTGLGQSAALIDGNGPADFPPVGFFGKTGLNLGSVGVTDDRLSFWGIALDAELAGRIPVDPLAVVGLKKDFSQDTEVMNGRIPADALGDAPVQVGEAVLPLHLGGGSDFLLGKEGQEVLPCAQVALQRSVVLVLGSEPRNHPNTESPRGSIRSGGTAFLHFFGSPQLSGLSGLCNRIMQKAGGLLNPLSSVIEVLNPPVGASYPLVQ